MNFTIVKVLEKVTNPIDGDQLKVLVRYENGNEYTTYKTKEEVDLIMFLQDLKIENKDKLIELIENFGQRQYEAGFDNCEASNNY